jgi:hypothetical protein
MVELITQDGSPDSATYRVSSSADQAERDSIFRANLGMFDGPPDRPSFTPEHRRGLERALLAFLKRHEPPPTPFQRRCALLDDDRLVLSIKRGLEQVAIPLGRAAAAFVEQKCWFLFGHARVGDYATARLGRSGRWLRDQASMGRTVARFPDLRRALAGKDGGEPLGKVVTLVIGGIATEESISAWIALARRSTVRQLKQEVQRARGVGSVWPTDRKPAEKDQAPGATPHSGPSNSAAPLASNVHRCSAQTVDPPATEERSANLGMDPREERPAGPGMDPRKERPANLGMDPHEQIDERRTVCVPLPYPVREGFYEALELLV